MTIIKTDRRDVEFTDFSQENKRDIETERDKECNDGRRKVPAKQLPVTLPATTSPVSDGQLNQNQTINITRYSQQH